MRHGMFGVSIGRMAVENVHSGLIPDLLINPGEAHLQRGFELLFANLAEVCRIIIDHIQIIQRRAGRLLMQKIPDGVS